MKTSDCIDAGTEYCPCYLAETGECIMCSQLQGKVFCDCTNWKGVCIYQEYMWNHLHAKESRKEYRCKILICEQAAPLVILLTVQVNRTLARELKQPGAYVFLRPLDSPPYFEIPLSVMKADERAETVVLAVQERGVKTKYLFKQSTVKKEVEILLRGPFWNGILGLSYLKSLQKEKALLVIRGIGQAPAVPVAKKLIQGGNEVEVLLDTGKIQSDFAAALFREMGCHVVAQKVLDVEKLLIPDEVLTYIKDSFMKNGVKLIYCGGPELLHRGVSALIQQTGSKVDLACSNDAKLCCGEGICGSCQTRIVNGSRTKICKTQLDPRDLYGGR